MGSRLEKLRKVVSETLSGSLSGEMSAHRPGKWCAVEVLEHLYLSYTGTTKGFERVAAVGKSLATSTTWPQHL